MANPGARELRALPEQEWRPRCSLSMAHLRKFFVALLLGALMAACVPTITRPPVVVGQRPVDFPEQYYLQAMAENQPVYRIDPEQSLVVIEVRRGGPLARLGHEHVVASHDARGYIAPGTGRADLYFEIDRLAVDEPSLRSDAGFDTTPSEDDIAGTRRNMLAKVLDAESYPFALVRVTDAQGDSRRAVHDLAITLRGATRVYRVPVEFTATSGEIAASGRMKFNQSDFGIVPLAILNGAIQVQDELDLRFVIVARRARN